MPILFIRNHTYILDDYNYCEKISTMIIIKLNRIIKPNVLYIAYEGICCSKAVVIEIMNISKLK